MPDRTAELNGFMRAYEEANNSHDIDRVTPMIADDATYWFTDGSYCGTAEIAAAISRTFRTVRDETYEISELEWTYLPLTRGPAPNRGAAACGWERTG